MKWIVFSDLDGTILDERTYSAEGSREGILLLKERKIPLILVSSKTLDEMKEIQDRLGLEDPFIFENGGGFARREGENFRIDITGPGTEELAVRFRELCKVIDAELKPVPEMTIREICELTGLDEKRAGLARRRLSSLPFRPVQGMTLNGKDDARIREWVRGAGLSFIRGKRFFYLLPGDCDKGSAVRRLMDQYRAAAGTEAVFFAGIGDGENDWPMLGSVDRGFVVRRPDGSLCAPPDTAVSVTEAAGPSGFTEAVRKLLKETGD